MWRFEKAVLLDSGADSFIFWEAVWINGEHHDEKKAFADHKRRFANPGFCFVLVKLRDNVNEE